MQLPDFITDRLHNIAKSEGFIDYKIETKAGSNHGDNFLGIMTAVTLSGTKGLNGKTRNDELHLICKMPPANEIRNKNFKTDIVFDREIYMYSIVLPTFMRFQREKGLAESDQFLSFPKAYVCEKDPENKTFLLIMEDLRPKNYQMWPKERVTPLDHELLIMRELGKLHAISFAMKDQRPHEFHTLKPTTDTLSEIILHGKMRTFMHKTIQRATSVLKNPAHKKMMLDFEKTFAKHVDSFLVGPWSKEYGVINHGDCWNNNFLFEYADDNKNELKSVCLLDFQLARYSPPVLDLLYNIFSSTDKKFRAEHYEKLLKCYYASLCDMIEKLGSDPKKLYTYENLQAQMRKFGEFALLTGPMIIQIRVAAAKDILNLDDYAEQVEKGNQSADLVGEYDEDTQAEYSNLINDLVDDLVNYGYIKCK